MFLLLHHPKILTRIVRGICSQQLTMPGLQAFQERRDGHWMGRFLPITFFDGTT
jgi:hypothetical protein